MVGEEQFQDEKAPISMASVQGFYLIWLFFFSCVMLLKQKYFIEQEGDHEKPPPSGKSQLDSCGVKLNL